MTLLHALILALLQGFTEFLPISSSAHLILPSQLLGWPDQGLGFDVSVHVGTLTAVIIYFRKELLDMSGAWVNHVFHNRPSQEARLAWAVLWGTVPVGIFGLIFKGFIEENLRTSLVIASTTLIFGLLMWYADRLASTNNRDEHQLTIKDVAIIGIAQAIALIPGTSRSGITMTAGLLMGLNRSGAARFSFLLSIPVIILAGGLKSLDLLQQTQPVQFQYMLIGMLVSAITALFVIHFFLKLLDRMGLTPYVIYRLMLSAVLFWMVFFN